MAIVDRKRIRKQNNLKVLEGENDAEDVGEWETAEWRAHLSLHKRTFFHTSIN